jgi:hypothetical protein
LERAFQPGKNAEFGRPSAKFRHPAKTRCEVHARSLIEETLIRLRRGFGGPFAFSFGFWTVKNTEKRANRPIWMKFAEVAIGVDALPAISFDIRF